MHTPRAAKPLWREFGPLCTSAAKPSSPPLGQVGMCEAYLHVSFIRAVYKFLCVTHQLVVGRIVVRHPVLEWVVVDCRNIPSNHLFAGWVREDSERVWRDPQRGRATLTSNCRRDLSNDGDLPREPPSSAADDPGCVVPSCSRTSFDAECAPIACIPAEGAGHVRG
jgi:hypothetical protein